MLVIDSKIMRVLEKLIGEKYPDVETDYLTVEVYSDDSGKVTLLEFYDGNYSYMISEEFEGQNEYDKLMVKLISNVENRSLKEY